MTDMPGSNVQKTLDGIGEAGVFAPADLEEEGQVRALPEIASQFGKGRLDIVVNCAAFVGDSSFPGWAVPFEQQSTEAWRRALEVNLTSAFALIQSALPYLQRSPNASIVNIGSIYGVGGPDLRLYEGTNIGNPAAYAASKGGLVQLTRWLATTLAPKVRVNCVSPGGLYRGHTDPFLTRYLDRVPLGRMGTEADVVGAVVFLAGDLAAYITGQNLMVDGGWTAW
jgi:NAD(P)-dependent dehydrogenase (short-subunit alcohol dehydrogenase family)